MLRDRRFGRAAAVLAIGLGVLLGLPLPGQAQLRDRLEDQLRTTDEILVRAREVVQESDSQRARDTLENAARIQDQAWEQFRAQQGIIAARLTLEARQSALRALDLAREDSGLRARAFREGEKALRALQLAREAFDGAPGDQARRLLDEARAQIERGRIQFNEQHYEAAIRLAVSAQSLIQQALGTRGDLGGERVQRELERTDRLIERVQPVVRESDIEEAARMLDRGVNLQSEAQEVYRAGRYAVAYTVTLQARALVNHAAALVHGPLDSEGVGRALEETDRVLDGAAEIVRPSGDENAIKLLEKAREHQLRARGFLDDGEMRAALAETRVARSLGKRALRMAQDEGI